MAALPFLSPLRTGLGSPCGRNTSKGKVSFPPLPCGSHSSVEGGSGRARHPSGAGGCHRELHLTGSLPLAPSSLPEEKNRSSSSFETCLRPSEKPEGERGEPDPEQKRSRARERRREGRSKTFDWAEFRPIQQALAQERASATGASDAHPEAEAGELERERARRREERRKRFGMLDATDGPAADDMALRMEVDRSPGLPVTADLKTQNVHVEIEQRWHQVETTPLREEKQVPIAPLHLSSSEDGSDRLSTHELTSLLEKEVMGRQVMGFCAAAFPSTCCTWWWPELFSHIILRVVWSRLLRETDTWTDRSLEYSAGTRYRRVPCHGGWQAFPEGKGVCHAGTLPYRARNGQRLGRWDAGLRSRLCPTLLWARTRDLRQERGMSRVRFPYAVGSPGSEGPKLGGRDQPRGFCSSPVTIDGIWGGGCRSCSRRQRLDSGC